MSEDLYRMCTDCKGSGFEPAKPSVTFMCFRYSCSTCMGQGYVLDEEAGGKVRAWDKALETAFKAITEILEPENETEL